MTLVLADFNRPPTPAATTSSPLDPEEIPWSPPPEPPHGTPTIHHWPAEVAFRHSGWQRHRIRVFNALSQAQARPNRLERFARCGSDAWVYEDLGQPGHYLVKSSRCRDRFCVPCRRETAHTVATNVTDYARDRTLRLITLTLRHSQDPLADQLDRLYRYFRRLRKEPLWRAHCHGGVAFLEIKRSKNGAEWHPHFHCLVEGTYVHHTHLSEVWHRITRHSYIVDVRKVQALADAARYVTKYATKPIAASALLTDRLALDCVQALWHRRLMFAFGTWRGLRLHAKPAAHQWRAVAPLFELLERAGGGDAHALAILRQIRRDPTWQPQTTIVPSKNTHPPPPTSTTTSEPPSSARSADTP